jgi:hypothetical protein
MDSIDVSTEKDQKGVVKVARIRFGPHHVVEVRKRGKKTIFTLVATHHGFRADASLPGGELEKIIEEIRGTRPETTVD